MDYFAGFKVDSNITNQKFAIKNKSLLNNDVDFSKINLTQEDINLINQKIKNGNGQPDQKPEQPGQPEKQPGQKQPENKTNGPELLKELDNVIGSLNFGTTLNTDTLKINEICKHTKYIWLYFSAFWCPPCKRTTPLLKDSYNKLKIADNTEKSTNADLYETDAKTLEIIWIPVNSPTADNNISNYFKEMPWYAMQSGNENKLKSVQTKYGITTIPAVIQINVITGEHITIKESLIIPTKIPIQSDIPKKLVE